MTLDSELYLQLQKQSAESGETIASLIDDAVIAVLHETAEDLKTFEERADGPTYSFDELVEKIGLTGKV